jgi:hypothetical protein
LSLRFLSFSIPARRPSRQPTKLGGPSERKRT